MRTAVRPPRDAGAGAALAPLALGPVALLTAAVCAVLLVLGARSGYTGGELTVLAAGRHLSWGYADRPALLPALSRLLDSATGGATIGARLPGTVLTSAGVGVTALTAREFGGNRRAQVLAAAVYASSAFVLGTGYVLSATTVDAFLWAVCGALLVRWARTGDNRLLGWLGVVTAVALQTEYLILVFWAVLGVALLTVGPRELATRPRLWVAGGCALLAATPELVWQGQHGWPWPLSRPMIDATAVGPTTFPPLLLLAAGLFAGAAGVCYGVLRLLCCDELRRYAFLGWTAIGVFAVFLALGCRPYLAAGLFPVLWAAAAVEVVRHPPPRNWRWLASWPVLAVSALLALPGAPGLPGWAGWPSSPLTPLAWLSRDGGSVATAVDPRIGPRHNDAGWLLFAETVAQAYRGLPPESRRNVVIVTKGMWGAAALERFGQHLDLPPVYCAQRDYGFFGEPTEDATGVLYVGDPAAIRPYFDELRLVGSVPEVAPGATAFPSGTPLWLAQHRNTPWALLWPALRHS